MVSILAHGASPPTPCLSGLFLEEDCVWILITRKSKWHLNYRSALLRLSEQHKAKWLLCCLLMSDSLLYNGMLASQVLLGGRRSVPNACDEVSALTEKPTVGLGGASDVRCTS